MKIDTHGPEWRDWVLTNVNAKCSITDIFNSMAHLWSKEDASSAIAEAIEILAGGSSKKSRPLIPSCNAIEIDGQRIEVLAKLDRPNAALLDNVFSEEECKELIDYATSKGLKKSEVIDDQTGKNVDHEARTSTNVFFSRFETPLIEKLERRLAELTCWPVDHSEGFQVLRYEVGQQYKSHVDWFDASTVGGLHHLSRGGQRVATMVVYLSIPDDGGGTKFTEVGLEVNPRVGGAIFFNDVDEANLPEKLSRHAGTPVAKGYKIVATYWQREHKFV